MKRTRPRRRNFRLLALSVALTLAVVCGQGENPALAGGPLFVGSPTMGTDGQPLLWSTASPVAYRVDGGNLGTITNSAAASRVQTMFSAWQNVPTASISYTNAGPILSAGSFTDGDVSSAFEFADVAIDCDLGNQTPIMFDADGSLFAQLGFPSGVIGFAGACDSIVGNHITSALAALNGRWINGNQGDGELTSFEFDQAFTHEFGHLSGLDHSQINVDVLNGAGTCSQDSLAGLPLMFPFLFCQARQPAFPILAPDDMAWISELYPETGGGTGQTPYTSAYGFIEGTIYFSDGITHAQGINVIARQLDNPSTTTVNESRRVAFSAVSGYLFTGLSGQNVTSTNPGSSFGSRNTLLIGAYRIPVTPGNYRLEVESISPFFVGGSSVGPLQFPIPSPGPREFWDSGESANDSTSAVTNITVAAGQTISNINIILNGTPPRFDAFESAQWFAPVPFADLPPTPYPVFPLVPEPVTAKPRTAILASSPGSEAPLAFAWLRRDSLLEALAS